MLVDVFQLFLAACVDRFIVQLVDVNERCNLTYGNRIQGIRTLLVRPETEVYFHHVVGSELLFSRAAVGLRTQIERAEVSETHTLGVFHKLHETVASCHQYAEDSCTIER